MKRYIDADKLIAVIERQIESAAQKADIFDSVDDIENMKKYDDERNVLKKLLELVTSLQQEQPEADLEKEIGRWMDKLDDKYCTLVYNYSIQDIKDTARHFWNKGYNAGKEE